MVRRGRFPAGESFSPFPGFAGRELSLMFQKRFRSRCCLAYGSGGGPPCQIRAETKSAIGTGVDSREGERVTCTPFNQELDNLATGKGGVKKGQTD